MQFGPTSYSVVARLVSFQLRGLGVALGTHNIRLLASTRYRPSLCQANYFFH